MMHAWRPPIASFFARDATSTASGVIASPRTPLVHLEAIHIQYQRHLGEVGVERTTSIPPVPSPISPHRLYPQQRRASSVVTTQAW
jgi:hypothetical protein